jgi:hypothetical protein
MRLKKCKRSVINYLEYFHDLCLVWAPQIQRGAFAKGNPSQLADCIL